VCSSDLLSMASLGRATTSINRPRTCFRFPKIESTGSVSNAQADFVGSIQGVARWFVGCAALLASGVDTMIRKLKSGEYRLYSRKRNPRTGKRRNLGTFSTRAAAEKHERAVQFFKRG